jgi:hypothetical protein
MMLQRYAECAHAGLRVQVFNIARAVKAPVSTGMHAIGGALRSTAFLSSFVGIYQATVSAHRTLFEGDSKFLYWLAGDPLSSLAALRSI